MATLKEIIAADVGNVFMNTQEFAEPISYMQGMGPAIETTGIPEEIEFTTTDQEGFSTKFQFMSWLIPIADFGGTLPREGDTITRSVGAITQTYEVMPTGGKPSNSIEISNNMYRIETKQVN